MRDALDQLTLAMMSHDRGNAHRIHHFLMVHGFAALLGRMEGFDDRQQLILEAAALCHDIGIRLAMEQHGQVTPNLHETLGCAAAGTMLRELGFQEDITAQVAGLVGRHHSWQEGVEPELQLLIEADALVNLHAHRDSQEAKQKTFDGVFVSRSGRQVFLLVYPLEPSSL